MNEDGGEEMTEEEAREMQSPENAACMELLDSALGGGGGCDDDDGTEND